MLDLSIIIVNYNVQHFVEQTLLSVKRAVEGVSAEVIVVDNNSKDGSVQLIQEKFPWVKLIANKVNGGFSKANNQGIEISEGKYCLLLNPDTVVEEDTFSKIIQFMNDHDDCGGMGVKMIDGSGHFLPESKRSLPTPNVAFYKMFGLSSIFKQSKKFGKYHLSYLSKDETNEVEILAGAYMVLRKSVLDKIGLLDETFFMYGEDIDLSYRIIKAGYKNYYFADTKCIHYKGESTKKKDLNYIRVFYNAMVIFSNKHFTGRRDKLFSSILKLAIYFRAFIALINSYIGNIIPPIIDFSILYGGLFYITDYWEKNHRYIEGGEYPSIFLSTVIPIYIILWILGIYFSGGYDRPYRIIKSIRGVIIGTIILSIAYSFLNEDLRFSRAIILLGAGWAIFGTSLYRMFIQFIQTGSLRFDYKQQKKVAILGEEHEIQKTLKILSDTNTTINFIGQITDNKESEYPILGQTDEIEKIIETFELDEIMFCTGNYSYKSCIQNIENLAGKIDFKIVPDGAQSIIGSNNSSKSSGELYNIEMQLAINNPANKRNKRVLDILLAITFIPLFPILLIFNPPVQLIQNMFLVLFGKKSWVGLDNIKAKDLQIQIPKLKDGCLSPSTNLDLYSTKNIPHLNFLYLKDYSVWKDIKIVRSSFPRIQSK